MTGKGLRVRRGRAARLVGLLGVSAAFLTGCGSGGSSRTRATASGASGRVTTTTAPAAPETVPFSPASAALLSDAPPPWPLPADPGSDIINAGLSTASQETLEYHYHAHLDILVNGTAVPVAAGVGFAFDRSGQPTGISSLHTHDSTGVIHIESPAARAYTLGQFFTEWGVLLGPGRLGGLASGPSGTLQVFVNGRPFTGNPAEVVLKAHMEIAVWFGPNGQTPTVPSRYSFPAGE